MLWQQHLALPHQVSEAANWGLVGTAGDGDSGGSGGAGPTCPGAATLLRASWSRDRPWRETAAVAASCPGQEGPRGAAGAIPAHTVGGGGVRGVPGVPQWQVGPGKCLGWASAGVHPWGGGGYLHSSAHSCVCSVCLQMCARASVCAQAGEHSGTHTPGGTRTHTHVHAQSPRCLFQGRTPHPLRAHPHIEVTPPAHGTAHVRVPLPAPQTAPRAEAALGPLAGTGHGLVAASHGRGFGDPSAPPGSWLLSSPPGSLLSSLCRSASHPRRIAGPAAPRPL